MIILNYNERTVADGVVEVIMPVINYFSDPYWIGDFLCIGWILFTLAALVAFHTEDESPSNP